MCCRLSSVVLALLVLTFTTTAQAVTITHGTTSINMDFVTVGNPGNTGELSGESVSGGWGPDGICGAVGYNYRIGKYEVTADQWAAVIAADGNVGNAGNWSGSQPTGGTTWHEAARFCNWLTTGSANSGYYTIANGLATPNELSHVAYAAAHGTTYFIPTEDEWYKAAYYDPNKTGGPGYYDYPTGSDDVPDGFDFDGDTVFDAVFNEEPRQTQPNAVNNAGVLSPYGTMGQGGNVYEWNETLIDGSWPGLRGCCWVGYPQHMAASFRGYEYPSGWSSDIGFRVASVPEPGGIAMLLGLALTALLYWWRKHGFVFLSLPGGSKMFGKAIVRGFLTTVLVLAANGAMADTFGTLGNQFTIDFVPISGATNPTSGYGIVANDYRMGTYEITNDQWNSFKAAYGAVTGDPSYAYDADFYDWGTGTTDVPTDNVSWLEAAQFVNWLNTSTGHQAAYNFTGEQGTSNYTLTTWGSGEADGTNLYRHKNAFYFLPTEDEWVKAAYWNGTGLQTYATKAGESLTQGDGVSGTGWNYYDDGYATDPRGPWNVGSGSQELNGTYDMMGNNWEWMESPYNDPIFAAGSSRGLRGGYWLNYSYYLASSGRYFYDPALEFDNLGFRVASVPEPGGIAMLLAIALTTLLYYWRKHV